MNASFEAIVDNGVLRPLTPIDLPDQSRVTVTVQESPDRTAKAAAQRAAIKELWRELKAVPQAKDEDGWSAANHDDLLYGPKQ